MITIELPDAMAAAVMLRANQIKADGSNPAPVASHQEALVVVLEDNKPFAKLCAQMKAAWPEKKG